MSYISTVRVQIKPGMAEQIEQAIQERLVPARQELLARGDLLSMRVLRALDPADTYELITEWASKEAHDRNEDSPADRDALAAVAPHLAGPPAELDGSTLVELP